MPYMREYKNISIFSSYEGVSENMLSMLDEDLEYIEDMWDSVRKHNAEVSRENRILSQQVTNIIVDMFNSIEMPVFKKSLHGKVIGEYKEFKAIKKRIGEIFGYERWTRPSPHEIMVNGNRVRSNCSPVTLLQLVKLGRQHKAKKNKRDEEYIASIKYLVSNGVDVDVNSDRSEIISDAYDLYASKLREEKYPDGTELDIDICDECDIWVVGDHRCSCGNIRVELISEGNIVDGIYFYPSRY